MWHVLRFAIDPTIAAVSTLTIVLAAALLGGAHILRQQQIGRQTGTNDR
jgi:putative spermidine/putrescine transport system permease protein